MREPGCCPADTTEGTAIGAGSASGISSSLRISNGAVRKNVLPLPNSLVQPIRPPINSTNPLLMANPRPVPPYLRVVEESAWVKRSKIISVLSAAIPIPVSTTLNRSQPASSGSGSTRRVTLPWSVNFSAFPIRLMRICRRRFGSPTSPAGAPGRISKLSRKRRACAREAIISRTLSRNARRSKPIDSNSTCPDSTLEKSRTSLIRSRRFSPAL